MRWWTRWPVSVEPERGAERDPIAYQRVSLDWVHLWKGFLSGHYMGASSHGPSVLGAAHGCLGQPAALKRASRYGGSRKAPFLARTCDMNLLRV